MNRKALSAVCDKCGQLTAVEFKECKHSGGRRETYFTCDNCSHQFTTHVTDLRVRMWQEEKDKLKDPVQRQNLQLKINQRMKRLKDELNHG